MSTLENLFDCEVHILTPGEDFSGVATSIVRGWTSEDEECSGWESPALLPEIEEQTPTPWLEANAQGWGAFAIEARRLGQCLGLDMNIYQHNLYNPDGTPAGNQYTVQSKVSGPGWKGTRL